MKSMEQNKSFKLYSLGSNSEFQEISINFNSGNKGIDDFFNMNALNMKRTKN